MAMAVPTLQCHRCAAKLPSEPGTLQSLTECPGCQVRLAVHLFPAWGRETPVGESAQPITDAQEAACFFHADRRAVHPCDQCGRFLCALCDFPIGNRHLCGGCVEKSARGTHLGELERNRKRWDVIVWYCLLLPLLLCAYVLPITAIVGIVLGIKHLKSPPSLVARSGLRLKIGIAFAFLELIAIAIGIVALARSES